ncbi:hypothetical protein ACFWCN_20200 [Streptomyces goshikiensis]|nr:hypothetical protein [Streptomyces sp. ADI95-16]
MTNATDGVLTPLDPLDPRETAGYRPLARPGRSAPSTRRTSSTAT